MSIRQSILKALQNRYNLDAQEKGDIFERNDSNVEWSHNCIVTQDWDELNEFIYANELLIKKPLYFDPNAKWSCLFLPKIKIRWASRIKQIKLGSTIFNMLEGKWDTTGAFTIDTDGISIKIYPYHGDLKVPVSGNSVCLIPFKNYTFTPIIGEDDIPPVCIANEKLECVYAAMHVNVSFNRQGLYINRKYREKTEYLNPSDLPTDYRIIEPASIEFREGTSAGAPLILHIRLCDL